MEFSPAYWEERYRSGAHSGDEPASPLLVEAVAGLAPRRALDAGCGRGAGAVELAARGWQVHAVDVSATALARGRDAAAAAGEQIGARIVWEQADLATWQPEGQQYDLVVSCYVHVPGRPQDLFGRLASWVAPAGTLVVVGHDGGHGHGLHGGHGHSGDGRRGHEHPRGALLRAEDVTAGLPVDDWEVVVAEPRTHVVRRPAGLPAVTLHDVLVVTRRSGAPRT